MQPLQPNIVTSESTQQTLFSFNSASAVAPVMGKKVALDFDGGNITSDAGVLLLSETESQLGIISMLTKCINDTRRPSSITHSINELSAQRVFQIGCGYEDCNDSNSQIAQGFVDHFLGSYTEPPEIIVLDFDDTEDVVHGHQQLALFNGYYQETCYQPLHVYEGFSGKLITAILRPGKRPGGREIVSYVKRIVERIRQKWPDTIMVYRGDSHYSAPEVFAFIDQQNDCYSVTGLTRNALLLKHVESLIEHVKQQPAGFKRYHSFLYKAESWNKSRRVVAKVEMTDIGKLNVRFISSDMFNAKAKELYEGVYCARGNDELYIKDHKTYTKSDRTSCHRFLANQFRLFLHSAAYVLLHSFRSNMLKRTSMATATFDTIRLKLLKTGARIIERKTKISVHLPTAYSYKWILSKCLAIFEHLRRQPWPPPAMS